MSSFKSFFMKKIIIPLSLLILFSFPLYAQDAIEVQKNTLENQMTEAFEKSNSYQEYKVVKKVQLATLRRNILDSVAAFEKQIVAQKNELDFQDAKIDSLTHSLANIQQRLTESIAKEDGMQILGIQTSKSTYNTVMWGLVVVLLIVGGFLFYRFLNSHKVTNAAELKIAELEIEIEDHRRNSLEREQKLRRKLQDEINKNRKV